MFGLILPHRPVLTPPTQITETQLAFPDIPASPPFSHLVVFLLPGTALPPNTGVAIYVKLPNAPTSAPNGGFALMGAIGPGRESAIFKVNLGSKSTNTGPVPAMDEDAMVDETTPGVAANNNAAEPTVAAGSDGNVIASEGLLSVGLSIEPAANIEAQIASLKTGGDPSTSGFNPGTSASGTMTKGGPAATTGGGAGNPVVSTKVLAQRIIGNAFNFLGSFAGQGPGGEEVVPLKAFRDWWTKFEKRVELDPGFLEREDGG
ncbi:MAG: hypothetical protein M1820_008174 [Bogoriella megaspora]|nr:MAG: hypothetical protein M1820_008174 [Bogoriella megaspora]